MVRLEDGPDDMGAGMVVGTIGEDAPPKINFAFLCAAAVLLVVRLLSSGKTKGGDAMHVRIATRRRDATTEKVENIVCHRSFIGAFANDAWGRYNLRSVLKWGLLDLSL